MLTPEEIIKILNLQAHPLEGGYFRETYRSALSIAGENLPPGYGGPRPGATAIYFMLTRGTFSEMHRLKGDEIFHFYSGSPVELLQLFPDGSGKKLIIGNNIAQGERPQVVVPAGIWQGSRLIAGGEFALMGTTMSPGFAYSEYQSGDRQELIRHYPQFVESIISLTRER